MATRSRLRLWSWVCALGLTGVCVSASLGRHGYLFDLCANLSAQVLLLSIVTCVLMLLLRRWFPALALGAGIVVVTSTGAWQRVPPASAGRTPDVRVLILNTRTTNRSILEVTDLIVRSGASVVMLTEPNPDLARHLRDDAEVRRIYPTVRMPSKGDPYQVTLSVWPVRDSGAGWYSFDRGRGAVFETPVGPVAYIQLHPRSPRSLTDWRSGNRVVSEAIGLAGGELSGLPVLICGDLNSAPSGRRSRELEHSGYTRSKPLGSVTGTYPAWSRWPMQIAIDDVWASVGWYRTGWAAVPIPGSDHLGVRVELSLDAAHRVADSQ